MCALQKLSVHADVIGFEVSLAAEFGDHVAVNFDEAGRDQLFGLAAGSHAGGSDDFLQAFNSHDAKAFCRCYSSSAAAERSMCSGLECDCAV